ncbi:MAG: DNA-processing protein DprA [Anaeromassilibacillus sp.]
MVVSGGALASTQLPSQGRVCGSSDGLCSPVIDYPYLAANTSLREAISHSGALLSSIRWDTGRNHFPIRNRLISGLSVGTVQAAERAGLCSPRTRDPSNRDVFACPAGREPYVPRSQQPFARGNEGGQLCK